MKKALFIVAVMLLSISTVSVAQVKFGVKAGVNIANYGGDDGGEMDSRLAPLFGAFAKVEFSEKLAFQPELLYSMKGAKASEQGIDVTERLDYLDVPLMLKFYVSDGFNLQAGPQLSFLLSAEGEYESGDQSYTEDYKDYLKGLDFGFNIGAGYDLDFGLGFDVRYGLGLTNVVDEGDGDVKNTVVQFGVSYAF